MRRFPTLLAPSLGLFLALSCGGTTDTGDLSNMGTAGTSSGGSSAAGSSAAGSSTTAGSSAGGSSNGQAGSSAHAGSATAGTDAGGTGGAGMGGMHAGGTGGSLTKGGAGGAGGVIVTAGTGGTIIVADPDPRCPTRMPTGSCSAEESGASCWYDLQTNCLCQPQPPNTFGFCTKVDPTCTYATGGTGAGGSAAGSSAGGVGGLSAKVAAPPRRICTCTSGTWNCVF